MLTVLEHSKNIKNKLYVSGKQDSNVTLHYTHLLVNSTVTLLDGIVWTSGNVT